MIKMFFLVCQLVIIAYIIPDREGRFSGAQRRAKPYFNIYQNQNSIKTGGLRSKMLPYAIRYENIQNRTNIRALIGLVDDMNSKADGKNPELNKIPRSSFLHTGNHSNTKVGNLDTETAHLYTMKALTLPLLPGKSNTEPPKQQNSKNFWNHFMYKMNAGAQDIVIPIKAPENQQGTCRAVPFTQDIFQKDCKKEAVQNHMCFGKCLHLQVYNQSDQVHTCFHCVPSKFTLKRKELKCTGSGNVMRVIMVVEECKCEVHVSNKIQKDHFDMDSHTHEHD